MQQAIWLTEMIGSKARFTFHLSTGYVVCRGTERSVQCRITKTELVMLKKMQSWVALCYTWRMRMWKARERFSWYWRELKNRWNVLASLKEMHRTNHLMSFQVTWEQLYQHLTRYCSNFTKIFMAFTEQPPTFTSLSTSHSTELVTITEVNSVLSILKVITSQPFSVALSGLSSVSSVINLIISNSTQPCTAPLLFPLFSTAALPTQRRQ